MQSDERDAPLDDTTDDGPLATLADGAAASAPPPPVAAPLTQGAMWLLVLGICLVALNLRPALATLSPVLPEVMRDMGLSAGAVSLFTTASVLLLGLCAPFAPGLARRFGTEAVILVALALIGAGTAIRYFATLPAMMLGSIFAGIGICLGNVLVPGLVKRDFSRHVPVMTGLYTMCLCASAAVPAGMTVPLADMLGGWPVALSIWAFPALLAMLVWLPQLSRGTRMPAQSRVRVKGLWRDPLAWQITFYMGLQSSLAYSVLAFFAPILRDRGVSPVAAGLVVSVAMLIQAPSALLAPVIAAKGRDQRLTIMVALLLSLAGMMGVIFAPVSGVWFWAICLGIGQGATFALALTLIALRSPDGVVAAQMSSMSQTWGYILAATGPFLVGVLHDWTGGWTEVGLFLAAIALCSGVAGLGAGRRKFVRSETVQS
jgi:CP family cyanate transporter-like MFS transporter